MGQYNDKERVGVDMNQEATGYEVPGEGLGATVYAENQTTQNNGGLGGHVSCEGEADSFQTVNLNDEHESWGLDQPVEAEHVEEDPSILSLLCDEHLNGDPLAEVCSKFPSLSILLMSFLFFLFAEWCLGLDISDNIFFLMEGF